MSAIQAIIFHKGIWDIPHIKKWLRTYKFKPIAKMRQTNNFYRYRIRPPDNFSHYITKKTKHGIEFIIGFY